VEFGHARCSALSSVMPGAGARLEYSELHDPGSIYTSFLLK
jgi:hypothetical protein